MAVVPTCPRCRGVLAGTGRREICPRCGEAVVAFARKLCARCGTDVSNTHRFKDTAGEYYCEACWPEVCEAAGAAPAYPCVECGEWFAADQVYQQKNTYICTGCYETRTSGVTTGDQAEAVLSALAGAGESPALTAESFTPSAYTASVAARAANRRKKSRRMIAILVAAGVVLFVLFVVWLQWSPAG